MTGKQFDPIRLRGVIEDWARQGPDGDPAIRIDRLVRAEGGHSSETWLIDAADGAGRPLDWVLKIEPRGNQIYEDPSVERQFRMAQVLIAHSDLPIPAVMRFEPDETLIGAPFFIMARVDGVAPPYSYHAEGVLHESAAPMREAMWLESLHLLARLHALDPAPFAFLAYPASAPGDGPAAPPEDGIAQELARWDSYRAWGGLPATDLLDTARRWLDDHRPAATPPGVAWGDARLGNIMYHNGRCAAMLDWETASLGGAETDLGWWIFYDEMIVEGAGIPRLPGIGDRAATVAAWEGFAGRRAAAIDWHVIFAAYRFVLISERAAALAFAAGRTSAAAMGEGNPVVRRLRQLLAET